MPHSQQCGPLIYFISFDSVLLKLCEQDELKAWVAVDGSKGRGDSRLKFTSDVARKEIHVEHSQCCWAVRTDSVALEIDFLWQ